MKAERGGRLPRSVLRYPSELLRISGDILSTRFAPQRVERVFMLAECPLSTHCGHSVDRTMWRPRSS